MYGRRNAHKSRKDLPIFKKGAEIFEVANRIYQLLPGDNEQLQHIGAEMLNDAALLTVKVAGATTSELYDMKMEAAVIIRKAARDLMVMNHSLEMFGFEYVDYYEIVRNLIEEYRLLFIQWVDSFDRWNYIVDRWGLFNPPGVGPFDKDPDDDLPWNGPDDYLA